MPSGGIAPSAANRLPLTLFTGARVLASNAGAGGGGTLAACGLDLLRVPVVLVLAMAGVTRIMRAKSHNLEYECTSALALPLLSPSRARYIYKHI